VFPPRTNEYERTNADDRADISCPPPVSGFGFPTVASVVAASPASGGATTAQSHFPSPPTAAPASDGHVTNVLRNRGADAPCPRLALLVAPGHGRKTSWV